MFFCLFFRSFNVRFFCVSFFCRGKGGNSPISWPWRILRRDGSEEEEVRGRGVGGGGGGVSFTCAGCNQTTKSQNKKAVVVFVFFKWSNVF